jgi:HSP90 family molecular chaperone
VIDYNEILYHCWGVGWGGFRFLFFTNPIDEHLTQNLIEYEGKKFQNASKDDLKIGSKYDQAKTKEIVDLDPLKNMPHEKLLTLTINLLIQVWQDHNTCMHDCTNHVCT